MKVAGMGLRPSRRTLSRRLLEHNLCLQLDSLRLPSGNRRAVLLDLGGVGRYRSWLPAGRLITCDLNPRHRPDVVGRGEHIPLQSASVDFVISTEVLEHCPEPAKFAMEIHRVMRPGGMLVLTTPFVYVVHGWPQDYYRFTASGLEHLFRVFTKIEVSSFGNRFVVMHDLMVGFTPFLSSWLNALIAPLTRGWTSRVCPAGHVLVAMK